MKIFTIYLIFLLNIIYVCSCKAGDSEIDQKDEKKISADMVRVPAGEFVMGTNACTYIWSDDPSYVASEIDNCSNSNDNPGHKVYVDEFYIDAYEVTMDKYLKCIESNICDDSMFLTNEGYKYSTEGEFAIVKPLYPIRGITWFDADKYCKWMHKRLPTEAEWEKAARGPENFANPWGNERVGDKYARIGDVGLGRVGSIENDKSGYGVYDMAGNVMEWVSDWYDKDYYNKNIYSNPKGPIEGIKKSIRGEAFVTNTKFSSRYNFFSTKRGGMKPTQSSPFVGFRCAKSSQ